TAEGGEGGATRTQCTGAIPTGTLPPMPTFVVPAAAAPAIIKVDASQLSGAPKKAGLGTLFGVTAMPKTPPDLVKQTQIWLSEHMMTAPYNAGEVAGTSAVLPLIAGSGVKMVARYN